MYYRVEIPLGNTHTIPTLYCRPTTGHALSKHGKGVSGGAQGRCVLFRAKSREVTKRGRRGSDQKSINHFSGPAAVFDARFFGAARMMNSHGAVCTLLAYTTLHHICSGTLHVCVIRTRVSAGCVVSTDRAARDKALGLIYDLIWPSEAISDQSHHITLTILFTRTRHRLLAVLQGWHPVTASSNGLAVRAITCQKHALPFPIGQ